MESTFLKEKTILLLGAGSIAEAMVRGLISADAVKASQIHVTNRSRRERLQVLREKYGVHTVENLASDEGTVILRQSDCIVIACKPNDVAEAIKGIREKIGNPVLLSVAAGISTGFIESLVGKEVEVVRAMPNTSCAVLQSATAVSFGRHCTERGKRLAMEILSVLGTVSVVEETAMDAVTGLSGSGPAYIYYLVEAMEEAAQSLGLPQEAARTLILQTLYGAALMLRETGLEAEALRRQVTSPNGTTAAGIQILEEAGFKHLIRRVISRAAERSRELGKELVIR